MFICHKTVITYFCAYSPANRSASWISCAPSHLFSLLVLGLLGMLSSYRPNSTAHPHHCHRVTSYPQKVTYLILWLFSSSPYKRWLWNVLKTIASLCAAIMKEHLGHGAQIVGSGTRMRILKIVDSQVSENRYIMLFSLRKNLKAWQKMGISLLKRNLGRPRGGARKITSRSVKPWF